MHENNIFCSRVNSRQLREILQTTPEDIEKRTVIDTLASNPEKIMILSEIGKLTLHCPFAISLT